MTDAVHLRRPAGAVRAGPDGRRRRCGRPASGPGARPASRAGRAGCSAASGPASTAWSPWTALRDQRALPAPPPGAGMVASTPREQGTLPRPNRWQGTLPASRTTWPWSGRAGRAGGGRHGGAGRRPGWRCWTPRPRSGGQFWRHRRRGDRGTGTGTGPSRGAALHCGGTGRPRRRARRCGSWSPASALHTDGRRGRGRPARAGHRGLRPGAAVPRLGPARRGHPRGGAGAAQGLRRRGRAGGSWWPGPGRSCCRSRWGWPRPGSAWSAVVEAGDPRAVPARPGALAGVAGKLAEAAGYAAAPGPAPGPVPSAARRGRGPRRPAGHVSSVDVAPWTDGRVRPAAAGV